MLGYPNINHLQANLKNQEGYIVSKTRTACQLICDDDDRLIYVFSDLERSSTKRRNEYVELKCPKWNRASYGMEHCNSNAFPTEIF